jgi:2,3-bisphosphoglycerate-independent phosphoglycerate mutase
MASAKRKLLLVVMDGVGHSEQVFGNAVLAAKTPNLDFLSNKFGRGLLHAHGKYVGLPSNKDMGNSEVGHNALGGGRVVDQGAKLVQMALDNGSLFKGESWNKLLRSIKSDNGTLHLLGLLSDGNVHSHENHLHARFTRRS